MKEYIIILSNLDEPKIYIRNDIDYLKDINIQFKVNLSAQTICIENLKFIYLTTYEAEHKGLLGRRYCERINSVSDIVKK